MSDFFSIFREMSKNQGVALEASILEAGKAISALDEKEKGKKREGKTSFFMGKIRHHLFPARL